MGQSLIIIIWGLDDGRRLIFLRIYYEITRRMHCHNILLLFLHERDRYYYKYLSNTDHISLKPCIENTLTPPISLIPGTSGRRCNRTSTGSDNCDSMCCGRGYNLLLDKRTSPCRCQFKWCCQVTCDRCDSNEWISVCN